MGVELRAGSGAELLQRILAMRLLRGTAAVVLSIVAVLPWMASEAPAQRGPSAVASTSVASDASPALRSNAAERHLTSRTARQSARAVARQLLVVRARTHEGDGEPTLTSPLASSPARLTGDVAESARERLRQLALSHPPFGEPSPFDATAPPTSNQRNG